MLTPNETLWLQRNNCLADSQSIPSYCSPVLVGVPIRAPSSFDDLRIPCFRLIIIHQPLEKKNHCYWIASRILNIYTNELGHASAKQKNNDFQSTQRFHDNAVELFSLLDARIADRKSLLSNCSLALFREFGIATQRSIPRYTIKRQRSLSYNLAALPEMQIRHTGDCLLALYFTCSLCVPAILSLDLWSKLKTLVKRE
jgi:hypothetical protein